MTVCAQEPDTTIKITPLEELLNIKMISASNLEENITEAPAMVIILTEKELSERGYLDASEIFNDLPGMDVTRPFGDTYFLNYFRGFRHTIGSPYKVMIDGFDISNLYFGTTTHLATIPITNIKQIEIVYGPSSSLYGADAFMGVINVITKSKKENGTEAIVKESMSTTLDNITDFSIVHRNKDFTFSLASRIQQIDLENMIDNDKQYWLNDSFLSDSQLWGDYLNNPELSQGKFHSQNNTKGIDIRVKSNNLMVGYLYNELKTGYGSVYPQDRLYHTSEWKHQYHMAFISYSKIINEKISSITQASAKNHSIAPGSYDIEAYNLTNGDTIDQVIGGQIVSPNESVRVLDFSYWHSANESFSFNQMLNFQPSEKLIIKTGFWGETRNVQKAYNRSSNILVPSLIVHNDLSQYPEIMDRSDAANKTTWRDLSAFAHAKYNLSKNNIINGGVRWNNGTVYGDIFTYKIAYIGQFKKIRTKIFYATAFQDPVPRSLYGGWEGSGSNPSLESEESRSFEINFSYTDKKFTTSVNTYYTLNNNNIINVEGGAKNIGSNQILGLDYLFDLRINTPKRLSVWLYYSSILMEKELKFDSEGNETEPGIIGDLAHHKVYLGTSYNLYKGLNINIRARYIGSKETIDSNPIPSIDGYTTTDLHLQYTDLFFKGFSLGLKVDNIFNATYYHTGIRDANSGDPDIVYQDPSSIGWQGNAWSGSQGWYNSRLIQPHRMIWFTLGLRY